MRALKSTPSLHTSSASPVRPTAYAHTATIAALDTMAFSACVRVAAQARSVSARQFIAHAECTMHRSTEFRHAAVSWVQSRGLFGQKFDVATISAIRRTSTGSLKAQWARHNELIPGIVYGYDASGRDSVDLIYVREADLRKAVNSLGSAFSNTLFDIEIDGVTQRVLPRDFQVHPFRPKAIAINWLRYRPGAYPGAKLEIPLKTFNDERCTAFKEGGWLLELIHKLPVYASGTRVPDYLMMDLRGLRVGDKIMASSLHLNDGLTLRSKVKDFAVAKIVGSRRGADDAADAAAPAAAKAAAPAAAGAAKAAAPAPAAGAAKSDAKK